MTDVIFGERMKKVFRMLLKTGIKMLKLEEQVVSENLALSQNPVIKNLNTLALITAKHITPTWQRDQVRIYCQAALWTITKDTAYRDPFFWMLNKLLERPEEMRKLLAPYVKDPKDWTANRWFGSKMKSDELKRDGKIPKNSKSLEETLYTPSIQEKRFEKLLKKRK